VPLSRFVPKENLIVYIEFSGLDAHADAWKNTAACKMLSETPLGEMLALVAAQLLDKALGAFPDNKLAGSEIVTMVKHAARSGWVLAISANPKDQERYRGTFVLRGAISKEVKPLASRMMGWMMGSEAKPRIVQKAGRSVVVVAPVGAGASTGRTPAGWSWWAEQNDLAIGFGSAASADAMLAALDGKAPTAVEHTLVQELAKSDGKFQPVLFGFADAANCPELPDRSAALLHKLSAEWGVKRIDFRWGFDGDALMSVARLVAPKPRKPALNFFDGPTFERTSLIALPDGVDSFIELSISPSRLLESLKHMAPRGEMGDQIDEMIQTVRTAGQIDLQKDLLAYLGPRMVLYLGTGQSAATNDDSLESELSKGWSPIAAVTAMQSVLPKLTLVAEVTNPEAFSKALDVAIIAINGEMKAQAMEKVAEQRAATAKKDGISSGTGQRNRRPPVGGDRTKRRRSLHDTPAPRFTLTPTPGNVKSFVLVTHSDSPIRYGPAHFRPTIQLEGKYVAFAVDPAAARAALAAAQRKDRKPSPGLARSRETLPPKLVALFYDEANDRLSSLLASLPGTLQTVINTSIALAGARAGKGDTATGGAGQLGRGASGRREPAGRGRGRMSPESGLTDDGPGTGGRRGGVGQRGVERPGAQGAGALNNNTAGGATTSASNDDSMVVLKVDADKLPKAEDLKAFLFPGTLCLTVSDQEIRLVSRQAFPDLSLPNSLAPIAGAVPAISALFSGITPGEPNASTSPEATGSPGAPGAARTSAGGPAGGVAPKSKGGTPGGARGRHRPDRDD
jgi:hypothetical protein